MLRPFFSFYGSKWRLARHYPEPRHSLIVEPFAGSAGYSLRYPDRDVLLIEADDQIAELWRYLITADPADVLALPLVKPGESIAELDLPAGARTLIGFWLGRCRATPARSASTWFRPDRKPGSFWSAATRARIAAQMPAIRHWRVICADYTAGDIGSATYFIDPPYERRGTHYRKHSIDFEALGRWSTRLRGSVIVCEELGASWLPFRPLRQAKSQIRGRSYTEAVYLSGF